MPFKSQVQEKLKNVLSKEKLELIPKGFQRIGDIIVLNLPQSLHNHKKEIARAVLELFPTVRTICNKTGGISGVYRQPQIEYLTGDKNTRVTHTESGCTYYFDITNIMFAKGNLTERTRIPKQVKKGEIILDMFAGIGYFTIPLAKLAEPKQIYAIELNPTSYTFLKENIRLNKLKNVIAIQGDNRTIVEELKKQHISPDRIIMGYLPPPKEFLPAAFSIAKKHTIIHYEDLVHTHDKEKDIGRVMNDLNTVAKQHNFQTRLLLAKCIKSYGPKIDHYVFDVEIF